MMNRFLVLLIGLLYSSCIYAAGELTEENAWWCHYTHFSPRGTKLTPGAVPVTGFNRDTSMDEREERLKKASENCPISRATLHGVLNGNVAPHIDGRGGTTDRSEHPYAVLVPFKDLQGSVVNAHPQDTYVIGHVSLQNAIIFVANSAPLLDVEVRQVIRIAEGGSIFEAVKEWLREEKLPILTFSWEDQKVQITEENFDYHFSSITERQLALTLPGMPMEALKTPGVRRRMIADQFEYGLPPNRQLVRVNEAPLAEL